MLEFEFNNNTPIYIQILRIIEISIISGEYPPGARLMSVRDLAIKLRANPNTVQRAISELENTGLIYTERTNGRFVTDSKELILKHKQMYLESLAEEYLYNMKEIGVNSQGALTELKNIIAQSNKEAK